MALVEVILPKMGESVAEATIIKWMKQVGENIELEESIVEIATDKVDSEVPSPIKGIIEEIKVKNGEIAQVGQVIALISTSENDEDDNPIIENVKKEEIIKDDKEIVNQSNDTLKFHNSNKFYSPLVKTISKKENITLEELEKIKGTGNNNRITKADILQYVQNKKVNVENVVTKKTIINQEVDQVAVNQSATKTTSDVSYSNDLNIEIVEMDRMRKIIAKNMIESKKISPHVTSFVEADVTNIVMWRENIKNKFLKKYNEKITFTPIFIEAIVKAIKDFPMINVSVDGDNILIKKRINIGMATALPSGNLILPVICNADQLNLLGIIKKVNTLAKNARENKLTPDDIKGATYSISNVGSFGNVMGTPIIPQPQVAILAVGKIRKKPSVIETPKGDTIGIRHMMYLSHSYDHRVVDGALGGMFVRKVADYLENFNTNIKI